jgi:hypothetical protein
VVDGRLVVAGRLAAELLDLLEFFTLPRPRPSALAKPAPGGSSSIAPTRKPTVVRAMVFLIG